MLARIEHLLSANADFAIETTLSTKSYVQTIKKCREKGYRIVLVYFWLKSTALAITRIQERVKRGGHYISDEVVKRRYKRGLQNLLKLFIPLCDYWFAVDNSENKPAIIAAGNDGADTIIYNYEIWETIKSYANEK